MVFLHSFRSGPNDVRASFAGPPAADFDSFVMTVDELPAGPVVITTTGTLDSASAPVFAECVTEALISGRAMVLDLLGVDTVDRCGVAIVEAAATRVASTAANIVVACTPTVQQQLTSTGIRITCCDILADAIDTAIRQPVRREALRRTVFPASALTTEPRIDARDALHGTYL